MRDNDFSDKNSGRFTARNFYIFIQTYVRIDLEYDENVLVD